MRFLITFLLIFLVFTTTAAGWNFDKHSIPIDEIMSGGPPKDGIPALTTPKYVSAQTASFLKKDEQVIGVTVNGEARAYPLKILRDKQEISDELNGRSISL